MLILVTTAHPQALEHRGDGFGRLVTPRHRPRIADTAAAGIPWAADNDCFQGLDPVAYRAMLHAITGLPGCKFVTVPDVVADAAQTLDLFAEWAPLVRSTRQPVALVAQDGLTADTTPWDHIGALFVGGSTDWKEGLVAANLVAEAKARGLWVHMGRVNGRRRFNYARLIGCDSVDGSSFARFRTTWLPAALAWHREPLRHHQPRLPIGDHT